MLLGEPLRQIRPATFKAMPVVTAESSCEPVFRRRYPDGRARISATRVALPPRAAHGQPTGYVRLIAARHAQILQLGVGCHECVDAGGAVVFLHARHWDAAYQLQPERIHDSLDTVAVGRRPLRESNGPTIMLLLAIDPKRRSKHSIDPRLPSVGAQELFFDERANERIEFFDILQQGIEEVGGLVIVGAGFHHGGGWQGVDGGQWELAARPRSHIVDHQAQAAGVVFPAAPELATGVLLHGTHAQIDVGLFVDQRGVIENASAPLAVLYLLWVAAELAQHQASMRRDEPAQLGDERFRIGHQLRWWTRRQPGWIRP